MRYFKGLQKKGMDGRTNWALMASFDIPCQDRLYLRRLRIIQTPWFAVYLHEMHGPDADRDLHDHPFDFYSIILKGGYVENWLAKQQGFGLPTHTRVWPRWSGHLMRKTEGHRIRALHETPTYTLVLVGSRTREWGFWTRAGWVPWDKYHEIVGGEKAV